MSRVLGGGCSFYWPPLKFMPVQSSSFYSPYVPQQRNVPVSPSPGARPICTVSPTLPCAPQTISMQAAFSKLSQRVGKLLGLHFHEPSAGHGRVPLGSKSHRPECRGCKYDNDSHARRRGTYELTNARRLWVRCTMIAITTENSALHRAVQASCARARESVDICSPPRHARR